jgi:hypothetical protein
MRKIIQKIGTESGIVAAHLPDDEYRSPWNLFIDGIWKSLGKQTRKVIKCYKQSLMNNSGSSLEDKNASRNIDSEGQSHKVLENKCFIRNVTF